jgi:hypothetical protein
MNALELQVLIAVTQPAEDIETAAVVGGYVSSPDSGPPAGAHAANVAPVIECHGPGPITQGTEP